MSMNLPIAPRYKNENERVTLGCQHTGKAWNTISDIAREHNLSFSDVIRAAIDQFLDNYEMENYHGKGAVENSSHVTETS